MPSPSALEHWATAQYAATAAHFNDPDCMLDWQIELHTKESKQTIPIVQRLLQDEIDASAAASEIAQICEPRVVPNQDVQSPQGVCLVLARAIEHFADDTASRTKLANLLVDLSKIDVRDASGNPVKTGEGREVFWSELPGWILGWRDNMTG